jgi:hypothetical protein
MNVRLALDLQQRRIKLPFSQNNIYHTTPPSLKAYYDGSHNCRMVTLDSGEFADVKTKFGGNM